MNNKWIKLKEIIQSKIFMINMIDRWTMNEQHELEILEQIYNEMIKLEKQEESEIRENE